MTVRALFSCGAASAVATKLAVESYGCTEALYCEVLQEHPDNERFLKDCEEWLGIPIKRWRSPKYGGDIYQVFSQRKFIKGPAGAPCTMFLKRQGNIEVFKPGDTAVIGFTAEEEARFKRLVYGTGFPVDDVEVVAPLIDFGATKKDSFSVLEGAGIELPMMYKLGYNNNNCIGCVKGGKGYWNRIRVDFPEAFDKMAALEKELGYKLLRDIHLEDLPRGAGRYKNVDIGDCGVFCSQVDGDDV